MISESTAMAAPTVDELIRAVEHIGRNGCLQIALPGGRVAIVTACFLPAEQARSLFTSGMIMAGQAVTEAA